MSTDSDVRPADPTTPIADGDQGTHIGLRPADIAPVLRSGTLVSIPIDVGDLDDGGTRLPEPIRIASDDPPG